LAGEHEGESNKLNVRRRPATRLVDSPVVSTDEVFLGVGLTVLLAVGSQVLASRLRIPALIVLLPVGFTVGALTTSVDPEKLLGPAFEPLVSLAVALIIYDAGLGLDLRTLAERKVVARLIWFGVPLTLAGVAIVAVPLLDLSRSAALMLAAILVVSGPTVVGPLLNFVRPRHRIQRILAWEGTLIDPVGAVLGAVLFNAIVSAGHEGYVRPFVEFGLSILVGLVGGAVGLALLWVILRPPDIGENLGTAGQLAIVIAVAAICDVVRDDTGLIAAIVMGIAAANLRAFDIPARRPFFETLIQVVLGLLFISISATVTPASLVPVIGPTLVLVAFLVLVVRPTVAFLATARTTLSAPERAFIGWMAPRGIVAAATASTFGASLASQDVAGAERILPVTFLIIVATVCLYGLSAVPVARLLGVVRSARTRPLLVGGAAWVLDLARSLRSAGLDPLIWAGRADEREHVTRSGLTLAPGELVAAAAGRGVSPEGITMVLLVTEEDDFNALAAAVLSTIVEGPVYRLAPPHRSEGVVAPYLGGSVLFGESITGATLAQRYRAGDRIGVRAIDEVAAADSLLFLVRADGQLKPVQRDHRPETRPGDAAVVIGPVAVRSGQHVDRAGDHEPEHEERGPRL
jgi:NhaP-type Na+/H+ or K+/H+ antiporter